MRRFSIAAILVLAFISAMAGASGRVRPRKARAAKPVEQTGAVIKSVTAGPEQEKKMENVTVRLETSAGPIRIRLYDDTPRHRDNFVKLVKEGFYDGVTFHRIIRDFMIQTGDPNSKKSNGAELGSGDPGYTVPAEIVYPKHYHKYGAVAAARTGDAVNPQRASSGSQFYIVTGQKQSAADLEQMAARFVMRKRQNMFRDVCERDRARIEQLQAARDTTGLEQLRMKLIDEVEKSVPVEPLPANMAKDYETIGGAPHLDNQYTVFGEVVDGMDVVEKLQRVPTMRGDRPEQPDSARIIKAIIEDYKEN